MIYRPYGTYEGTLALISINIKSLTGLINTAEWSNQKNCGGEMKFKILVP